MCEQSRKVCRSHSSSGNGLVDERFGVMRPRIELGPMLVTRPVHEVSNHGRLRRGIQEATPGVDDPSNANILRIDDIGYLDTVEADGRGDAELRCLPAFYLVREVSCILAEDPQGNIETTQAIYELSELVRHMEIETAV